MFAIGTCRFDGVTFVQSRDGARLGDQMAAVLDLMKDGKPRMLCEISRAVGSPEASVSARLRDLRKARFGGHQVDRQYVKNGFHLYVLVVRESVSA